LIEGLNGVRLDAEWNTTNIKIDNITPDNFTDDDVDMNYKSLFASGNGTPGSADGEFRFHFALLAGDYNGNGIVEAMEAATGDGDGDGDIDAADDSIGTVDNELPLRDTPGIGNDFDDNEVIDGGDLSKWKEFLGTTSLIGDFDGGGTVMGSDFLTWQGLFGKRSAWGSSVTETSAAAALAVGVEVGVAPQITNVTISGLLSPHAAYSFDTVDGSGDQLITVPVGGADTISITFSEIVVPDGSTLEDSFDILGLSTGNVPNLLEFSYDSLTLTATWRFDEWSLGDHYVITLNDTVTDAEGDALDGEWTNPVSLTTTNSAVSEFPSGDGTAGGRFSFFVTLLHGDANLDGIVTAVDAGILITNWGVVESTFALGDFNGDGTVDVLDFTLMTSENWGLNLQTVWAIPDFDSNGAVDEDDYDHVYANLGMQNPTRADGDLNGDGVIDSIDTDMAYDLWQWDLLWVA